MIRFEDLKKDLLELAEGKGQYAEKVNGLYLLMLDIDTIGRKIEERDERIETLEWSADDYFILDKEEIEVKIKKAITNQFFTQDAELCELFEKFSTDEVNDLIDDAVDGILDVMNKTTKADL